MSQRMQLIKYVSKLEFYLFGRLKDVDMLKNILLSGLYSLLAWVYLLLLGIIFLWRAASCWETIDN